MGRAPCCEEGVKKGPWSEEEDKALIDFIQRHGHGNWRSLPKRAGLLRCGKSCRLRWINYLRPDVKRGKFTPEEEETITSMHAKLGNKWSAIAANLPGRTDNEIKNVWHTYLKKRTHSEEATQAAVPVPKKSSKFKREAKNKLDHSASSANESGGDATRLLHTQVSVESTCNGVSSPDISTDSISAVSSSANYSNSTGAPNYCEELKEIDESFWLEALSMDITPAQVTDTAAPAAVADAFSLFANSEGMEFWLKVFMENMPQMDPEDIILAT